MELNFKISHTPVELLTGKDFCKIHQQVSARNLKDSSPIIFIVVLIGIHLFQLIFFQCSTKTKKISYSVVAAIFLVIVGSFSVAAALYVYKSKYIKCHLWAKLWL